MYNGKDYDVILRFKKRVTDETVCCENIAAAMFVTVKEMRAGPS